MTFILDRPTAITIAAAVVVLLFESAPGVIHTYNQAKSRETINNVKNSDRKGQRGEECYPLLTFQIF